MKSLETKSTVLLKHHLKALRLPSFLEACEKTAQRCATENVDHLGFLLQLCELELLDREKRSSERRRKTQHFRQNVAFRSGLRGCLPFKSRKERERFRPAPIYKGFPGQPECRSSPACPGDSRPQVRALPLPAPQT